VQESSNEWLRVAFLGAVTRFSISPESTHPGTEQITMNPPPVLSVLSRPTRPAIAARRLPGCRRLLLTLAAASLAISPVARALDELGSPTFNTAVGVGALSSNNGGHDNLAAGANALHFNTTGYSNTASGPGALYYNTGGIENTASGRGALFSNTNGSSNTATGFNALLNNTSSSNTASGANALYANTNGSDNAAFGASALFSNTDGYFNTASGSSALFTNTTGFDNTASGTSALSSNTTGHDNTASGYLALSLNSTGNFNTAAGSNALASNTGSSNSAFGRASLYLNTSGSLNTAIGTNALYNNSTGGNNSASGYEALFSNTTGSANTASGYLALLYNTTGNNNTGSGFQALVNNTTGGNNVAVGYQSLNKNVAGTNNTAVGLRALQNNINGGSNIGIGASAGASSSGSYNIYLGNAGATESNVMRLGTNVTQKNTYIAGIFGVTIPSGTGAAVMIDSNGHLGTVTSSERFKDAIQPMDKASEAILALKPVRFLYKPEVDPKAIPQFGLIAEQVAKVNPDLVVRDGEGAIYSVRYEAVNAMLLNEFLKEHRKVETQETALAEVKALVGKQAALIAEQQEQMNVLALTLKAQASQIQKVSARIETCAPAAQVAVYRR
jgi:hypothetical protein